MSAKAGVVKHPSKSRSAVNYIQTVKQLERKAVRYWPKELLEKVASISPLSLLLETQDKFISLLTLSDSGPRAWKTILNASRGMNANLFLKHLMVLTDLGGEALNKYPPFNKYFKDGKMRFVWREKRCTYSLKAIHRKVSLTNTALRVDGRGLLKDYSLDSRMEDVIMLLLHGASSFGDTLPGDLKDQCVIGSLIGQSRDIREFIKKNYIRISRQIKGAHANALGQAAEDYVREFLKTQLPSWAIKRGRIPGVNRGRRRIRTSFDIVAISPNNKCVAIEVSFQFTTNSTIERKAGQAEARARMLHRAGHHIAYVIDGAGNIDVRKAAIRTLRNNSDFLKNPIALAR
jgi:hypothetical protein